MLQIIACNSKHVANLEKPITLRKGKNKLEMKGIWSCVIKSSKTYTLRRIWFSETETGFSLVSTVLCTLLCETKTGFQTYPRSWFHWFRCWNVATPTYLLVCVGRWKL